MSDRIVFSLVLAFFKKFHNADAAWHQLVEEYSDFNLVVVWTVAIGFVVYFGAAGILTLAERSLNRQRKLQPTVPVMTGREWWFAAGMVFVNLSVVNTSVMYAYWYTFPKITNWRADTPLPTLPRVLGELVIFIMADEIVLYALHRTFHHFRWLYHHFHEPHHIYTAPTAITAIAAHPVDHLVINLVPVLAGPILMRSHLVVLWMWQVVALLSALTSHIGFDMSPVFGPPEHHDYHHSHGHAFYGALGVMDHWFGTDKLATEGQLCQEEHCLMKLESETKGQVCHETIQLTEKV
jgi:fatty acid hydroxylase domain-containing protein 2